MNQPTIVVVNIFSVSYSGSTWLNLLLGSHPQALSVGEAKRMLSTPKPLCSIHLESCPIFSQIDTTAQENLFLQIARVSGKRYLIVNNSRKLLPLQDHPQIERRFIHLVRDGRPTTASYLRKNHGHSMWRAARWWVHDIHRNQRLLNRLGDPVATVRYEDLQTSPAAEMQRLCASIGMAYEPAMLEYWNVAHHFIGGNVGTLQSLMRKRQEGAPEGWDQRVAGNRYDWDLGYYKGTDPAQFQDERWRRELTPWQLRVFRWWAGSTNRRYGYPTGGVKDTGALGSDQNAGQAN